MGFGLLTVGYLISYLASGSYFFPCILIGTVFLIAAVGKLGQYQAFYRYALIPMVVVFLYAAYQSVSFVAYFANLGGFPELTGTLKTVFQSAYQVCQFAQQEILLFATAKLAFRVGLGDLKASAVRNMLAVGFYFVLALAQTLLSGIVSENAYRVISVLALLCYFSAVILCLVLYYSAYMHICPRGEEDGNGKPSRFGFMNRFYEKLDEKQNASAKQTAEWYRARKERKKRGKH